MRRAGRFAPGQAMRNSLFPPSPPAITTRLEELLPRLLSWAEEEHTNISLPSLRVDGFSEELAGRLNVLRRSGLTFAPEAGTQRLRDVINKNLTEEEILSTAG